MSSRPEKLPDEGSRTERATRHPTGAHFYRWAFLVVGLLVMLVALIAANTRAVKLDWVVGSTHASLVWIILATAVIGWLLGVTTGVVARHHTRRQV